MTFESGAISKDWRTNVFVLLCKEKEERENYKHYKLQGYQFTKVGWKIFFVEDSNGQSMEIEKVKGT